MHSHTHNTVQVRIYLQNALKSHDSLILRRKGSRIAHCKIKFCCLSLLRTKTIYTCIRQFNCARAKSAITVKGESPESCFPEKTQNYGWTTTMEHQKMLCRNKVYVQHTKWNFWAEIPHTHTSRPYRILCNCSEKVLVKPAWAEKIEALNTLGEFIHSILSRLSGPTKWSHMLRAMIFVSTAKGKGHRRLNFTACSWGPCLPARCCLGAHCIHNQILPNVPKGSDAKTVEASYNQPHIMGLWS